MMKKASGIKKIAAGILGLAFFCSLMVLGAYISLAVLFDRTPEIIVPDLMGKDIVDVLERMEADRLGLRVAGFEFSSTIAHNHVIRQEPLPGHTLKAGREVRVFLSRGLQKFEIPDTRGLRREESLRLLENRNFLTGHFSLLYHGSIPAGHVIASDPQAGLPAKSGTAVHLLVSAGKRPVFIRMPDLGGMHADEMLDILKKRQLHVKKIESVHLPDMPFNRVMDQNPAPGSLLRAHEGVNVFMNRKQGQGREAQGIVSGMRLVRYRLPHTLIRSHIRGSLSAWGMTFDFVDDVFEGNSEVTLLIPGTAEARVRIEENGFPVYEATLDPFRFRADILYEGGRYGMPLLPIPFLFSDHATPNPDESTLP
ncbi:PASTA domain-containing protein [Desulfobotulus alkaliphilus]|uniref:PASTA domain-containing protein n=1 Tax=Desulfobotulus alkaliphilus TaxID=622671 RepID=A0A562RRP6_9BACT|nr:PASTA domain-containing protein [Desulfobotulus alkaliphilus]TWI71204.1 PASTA domain-containing protein [Desulfobotulus alkaliphilus]